MKFAFLILFFAALWPPTEAKADDIFWVELKPYFNYRDEGFSCGDRYGYIAGRLYLVAIVNDKGVVTYAKIRDTYLAGATREIALTPYELTGVKVEKEPFLGDFWVKSWGLTPRLTSWMLYQLIWNACYKRPSLEMATLTPSTAFLSFEQKESNRFYAKSLRFEGSRVDGSPYEAKLGFWQNLMITPYDEF